MGTILPVALAAVPVAIVLLLLVARGRLRALPRRTEQDPSSLFQMIEELMRQRPFTRSAVERITGMVLPGHDPDKYFETFMSDPDADAIIESVEARLATSASSKKDGMVILTVSTKAQITAAAVTMRFGPPLGFHVPHPEVPHGCSYSYRYPWGVLSFQFTRGTEYLETVVIDAIDPQPTAETGPAIING